MLERKGGYLIKERVFCLPGKGVKGCVCTGKEGWIGMLETHMSKC